MQQLKVPTIPSVDWKFLLTHFVPVGLAWVGQDWLFAFGFGDTTLFEALALGTGLCILQVSQKSCKSHER